MKRLSFSGNSFALPALPVILCVVLIVLAGCNNDSANNQGRPLVCLGDSLTAGFGATTPGRDDKSKSYPAYLQNKVNIPVINAGVSGDTTAQGLARVDSGVLSHKPQIVIICLGGNDFRLQNPAATIKENLQKIINKVNNGSRVIYLAKFYTDAMIRDLCNMYGITDAAAQTVIISQLDNVFTTLASENNVILIDNIWNGVWGIHMSDIIHPDARGYEIMANNIFNVIQPYLQANDLLKY